MKVFSGSSNKLLAQRVIKDLKINYLSPLEIHIFPDGERRVRVIDRIVGQDAVVIQSTSPKPDEYYFELFFIVDALKRSGARSVTVIVPYLGYQRQDHVFRDGEAVSLEVIIKTLESVGMGRLITFDLHSVKIPELFKIPVTHLSALPIFAKKIKELFGEPRQAHIENDARSVLPKGQGLSQSLSESLSKSKSLKTKKNDTVFSSSSNDLPSSSEDEDIESSPHSKKISNFKFQISNCILVSPDMGGIRRIRLLSQMLGNMPYISIVKNRDLATGNIKSTRIESNMLDWKKGIKKAIIVDDMISTGRTIDAAVDLLIKNGIPQNFIFATHPVFSHDFENILQNSKAEKIFVTDTIEVPEEKMFGKLEVLTVSKVIAEQLIKI